MRKTLTGFIVFALVVWTHGYATGDRTSSITIAIASNPAWAFLRVVGDPTLYNTPAVLDLPRDHSYLMRFEKDGYEPVLLRIICYSTLYAAGNSGLCCSETQAWDVQSLSEAQYRITQNTLTVLLKPVPKPPPEISQLQESPIIKETASAKDTNATIKELNALRRKGKITQKEYKALKKKALQDKPVTTLRKE